MDRLLDPGFIAVMIPILGIVALIIRRLALHKERMAMIEQGLDPDERAKQHNLEMEANKAAHKERMAMIEQGMYPDRPGLDEGDLERDPELIER